MTPANSLSTTLAAASAVTDNSFVTLEQPAAPVSTDLLRIETLYRMWYRAILDGHSAQLLRPAGCPVSFFDGAAIVELDFYALPSSADLRFELGSSIGTIGPAQIVELPRARDLIVPLVDTVELDFLPVSDPQLFWQTPCYAADGSELAEQELRVIGTTIRFAQQLFGVARMAATAWGHKHRLTVVIDKGDNRITLEPPVITVAWRNTAGETVTSQLELQVPECVQAALAICDGDGQSRSSFCAQKQDEISTVNVYYSTCTGEILSIRNGSDPEGFC